MEESRVWQAQMGFQQVRPVSSLHPLNAYHHQCLPIVQVLENRAVRLCLKHLRQRDYGEAFTALQKKARVELEHPLLTELHTLLVERGDFEGAERLMRQAVEG